MKPKRVRGSSFDDGFAKEPTRLNMVDNLIDDLVGFRLVFDSTSHMTRGGIWEYDRQPARVRRIKNGPGNSLGFLGFRLAREGS
jgi:hypothetical protein